MHWFHKYYFPYFHMDALSRHKRTVITREKKRNYEIVDFINLKMLVFFLFIYDWVMVVILSSCHTAMVYSFYLLLSVFDNCCNVIILNKLYVFL